MALVEVLQIHSCTMLSGLASHKSGPTPLKSYHGLSSSRKPQGLQQSAAAHSRSAISSTVSSEGLISMTSVATHETRRVSSENPLTDNSDRSPPIPAESQPSKAIESNTNSDVSGSPTSSSPFISLGATSGSTASPQTLVASNPNFSFPDDKAVLYPLHENRIDLQTSVSNVDLDIERLPPEDTGDNQFAQAGSNGAFENTAIDSTLFKSIGDGGDIEPKVSSHARTKSQTAAGGETSLAIRPESPVTLVITGFLSLSTTTITTTTTATGPTASNADHTTALDGSGLSQQPSKQSLGAIFGSVVGASIFAGCFFVLHRLFFRYYRDVGAREHAVHNAIYAGPEHIGPEPPHPEVSRFSKDS